MRKHGRDQDGVKADSGKASRGGACSWIGVDLGDRWSEVCVLSDSGDVVERTRVRTTPQGFRAYFSQRAGAQIALETGTHSGWSNRLLAECGLTVTTANAREIRKIHQSNRKNDRSDAETLARIRGSIASCSRPCSTAVRRCNPTSRWYVLARVMVRARTMQINAARGLVKAYGERLPACTSRSFGHTVVQRIPRDLQPALAPLLENIAALTTTDSGLRSSDRKSRPGALSANGAGCTSRWRWPGDLASLRADHRFGGSVRAQP